MFAQVVFPLPFRNSFTYSIPVDYEELVNVGTRVVVPFGKRVLSGFVIGLAKETDIKNQIRAIIDIIDDTPVFDETSLKFYEWLSEYYLCSLGEALRNSIPPGLDIESKRQIISDCEYCNKLLNEEKNKTGIKIKLLNVLALKESVSVSFLQKAVNKKNIYSVLKNLEKLGAITITDTIEDAKVKVKKVKYVELADTFDRTYGMINELEAKSPKQIIILLELLSAKGIPLKLSTLLEKTQSSQTSINSLESKKLVRVFFKEVERLHTETYKEEITEIDLTESQKDIVTKVADNISNKEFTPYLLYGVTGSGKTQVYIELAKQALKIGRSVLILVPEISLTPQMMTRFLNTFKNKVALIHSKMSLGERYDSWRGIVKGKYTVVIGARSAMFAPIHDIGLIVVDEEHDSSYKQTDLPPKFNARDSAIVKAKMNNCPIILGSATPSVESMYNAITEKYQLLRLDERVDDAKMPIIKLIDMLEAKKHKQVENIFSKELIEEIKIRIEKKEGVIILQNRRGFATQVYCDDCGEIENCPDCSVGLVHHIDKNILRCHYCGFTKTIPKSCSKCGSIHLKFFGTGTQRVEDELSYYLPTYKIERIDSDTMETKGKFGDIMNSFRNGDIDILVGTQIVSKGLDFANVTLVGVVSAETSLWMPDFRADERTFQLLTQVAGRAGRSKAEGEVLIQTQNPKNFVLNKVLQNDYAGFFEHELKARELNNYPPFARLALIEAKGEDENETRTAINQFYNILLKEGNKLTITNPFPAVIAKIKKSYRFHILIKCPRKLDPSAKYLRSAILNTYALYNQTARFKDIKIIIDIDPQTIM
ncbi:MAG: primosomal protein N' [bacterium]